jgi:hypothetical protein
MAMKLSYEKAIDEIKPALEKISSLTYPTEVPVSHLLEIAENLEMIEGKAKVFWDTRKKILEDLAEKDENGKPKSEFNEETKQTELVLTNENKMVFQNKLEELRDTKVDIPLKKLSKKHFNKVEKLTPLILKGILLLLKD